MLLRIDAEGHEACERRPQNAIRVFAQSPQVNECLHIVELAEHLTMLIALAAKQCRHKVFVEVGHCRLRYRFHIETRLPTLFHQPVYLVGAQLMVAVSGPDE